MRLIYVLLSPTFGMHQYTGDLANRAAAGAFTDGAPADVHVVTTRGFPASPYDPRLPIHTPLISAGTGFSPEGASILQLRRTIRQIRALAREPFADHAVVHITGVHLWNVVLVRALVQLGIPVVHTLHDLEAHSGVRFGSLIPHWNSLVIRGGAHILVHGQRYRDHLIAQGVQADRVTLAPLLHGFWGFRSPPNGGDAQVLYSPALDSATDRCHNVCVLFFGRVEEYKGVDTLLAAWSQRSEDGPDARLIVAGAWSPDLPLPPAQPDVEFRNRLITDDEGIELFRDASVLVLPYRDATQSALIAAGYAFALPVIVTDVGALAEYVQPGRTGWVVPSDEPALLAVALREALSDRSRLQQMGAEGHRWYQSQRALETRTLTEMYHALATRVAANPEGAGNGD